MGEPSPKAAGSHGAGSAPLAPADYRALVEDSPVLMWRADENGERTYFNDAWLTFTGRTAEQERGAGWTDAVHPDDRDRCLRSLREHLTGHDAFEIEYRHLRHDGTYRDVLERAAPREVGGRFSGFYGWTIDIEERRQSEQGRERFLRTMAHEMRTPLQALKVFLEVIRRNKEAGRPNSIEMFDRLAFQLDRLARLIDVVAEGGRSRALEIAAEPLDLYETLRALVDSLTAELRSDRLAIPREIELHEGPDAAPMRGDAGRLRLAFANLIGNALKYSPRGGPVLVTLEPRGREYAVTIEDRGIGIPVEELRQVGRRFYRASNVSARNFPGAGLGLSLAREIVEGHGGRVEIESGPDRGTRVTVLLPRSEDS